MKQAAPRRNKSIIRWTLTVILGLDLMLAFVSWRIDRTPRIQAGELRQLELTDRLYRADTMRLQKFRFELPADEKQWDEFFTSNFRPAGAGYSAISADLGDLSRSAGLRSDTISFREHKPDPNGLMEVEISTVVEGDYESLVNFVNKLEHSDNFYVLDSLALAPSSQGSLRLNVQLRTYFRT
jgi:Tfp pilus assembly protein PilO